MSFNPDGFFEEAIDGFGLGGLFGEPPFTVTVGDIVLEGATTASETGGWNAPSKKVEGDFPISSYSERQPIQIQLTAWVSKENYSELRSLRESAEPFGATVGDFSMGNAKLTGLDVNSTGDKKSHYEVTFSIEEIQTAQLEDSEMNFSTGGEDGSSQSSTPDSPTIGSSTEDTSGGTENTTDNGGTGTIEGIVNTVGGWF